jgi:hypothetical protein
MIVVDDRKGVIFTVFNQKILLEVFAVSVFFLFFMLKAVRSTVNSLPTGAGFNYLARPSSF